MVVKSKSMTEAYGNCGQSESVRCQAGLQGDRSCLGIGSKWTQEMSMIS